jgi:hypothetical protein
MSLRNINPKLPPRPPDVFPFLPDFIRRDRIIAIDFNKIIYDLKDISLWLSIHNLRGIRVEIFGDYYRVFLRNVKVLNPMNSTRFDLGNGIILILELRSSL